MPHDVVYTQYMIKVTDYDFSQDNLHAIVLLQTNHVVILDQYSGEKFLTLTDIGYYQRSLYVMPQFHFEYFPVMLFQKENGALNVEDVTSKGQYSRRVVQ